MMEQPVSTPVSVCGDIHGQYYDLKKLFRIGGDVPDTKYVFMGDYVDRGMYGLEILAYIFAQKIMLPEKVFLLRGNHEVKVVNGYDKFYGNRCFLGQLKERFSEDMAVMV